MAAALIGRTALRAALGSHGLSTSTLRSPLLNSLRPALSTHQIGLRQFSNSTRSSAVYVRFGGQPHKNWRPLNRDPWEWYLLGGLCVAGGIYVYTHLEKVPETGRTRFMDVSAKTEQQMAVQAGRMIEHEHGANTLPDNHPLALYVTNIVRRILLASNLGHIKGDSRDDEAVAGGMASGIIEHEDPRLRVDVGTPSKDAGVAQQKEWTVHVVQSAELNAFTTFGGHIVVYTGILPTCANDDGLAAVLGHEIAHVVARHPSEQVSLKKPFMTIAWVLEVFGLVPSGVGQMAVAFGLQLPSSRSHEYEADQIGVKLMARACFDPRESAEVFRRLHATVESQAGKLLTSRVVSFLGTHPWGPSRASALEARMDEAFAARAENSECGETQSRFEQFVDSFSKNGSGRKKSPPSPPVSLPPPSSSHGSWNAGDQSEFVDERPAGSRQGDTVWK
ncbi:peptidase family M48-domain-containing protein [Auriculariales sp. MPI-PUGE-AT-0066]|nr:peptidase family M48-domain-containing protein [Auriculariales sp. MPI-PUGE-AT-0066]